MQSRKPNERKIKQAKIAKKSKNNEIYQICVAAMTAKT